MKKYHTFSSLAHPAPNSTAPASSKEETEEAREAFLVELASFQLLLKKSAMICEAEARQVEEYQREKQRIGVYSVDSVSTRSLLTEACR